MEFVGKSKETIKIKEYAEKIANSDSPILIYGETGTGKEVLVDYIHKVGNRRNRPLVVQNCAAVPANLLESILFGTTKGAFTEATDKKGLFEVADDGIIYLDELNSMPIELQGKILRVLEDGMVRRIGGLTEIKVDVRVIASVNTEPFECVNKGFLRRDLFYRLNVFYLKLPELKDRKEDIKELCEYFIKYYNEKFKKHVKGISNEVVEIFYRYDWPGNIRELKNVLESVMNFKDGGVITIEDVPEHLIVNEKGLAEMIEEFEKSKIAEALSLNDYNISNAAKYLKIPRQTLQYKIKKYGL
ncbi:Arginine utilization regulatory protein RocR [Caloramator mitchellensis]|uniref:Arginine utilization regulatory protein RocR n=1 Tax=Caloramator mitchellensis TaxID=908809 RepID=A0A0R3JW22_CALMK|nr:sigma 54-interacting transcriptional regulator [Caloramator mitchellensis]KRQ87766.1 Arginine utilization regulatory protein RocR [Caloramator mitchellensis]